MAENKTIIYPKFLKEIRKNLINFSSVRKIISVVIFVLIWKVIVYFTPFFHQLPSPDAVFLALLELKLNSVAFEIFRSFYRVLAGFFLGILIGFPFGVILGYSRVANWLLFPAFEVIRPIPPMAWIPLSVLFFINVESQIIFLTFYGAFFPIVYNTISGISEVDIRLPRAAMSLGVSRKSMLWKIILPSAMPQIFTGLKLGIGITWILVVAAEMIASQGGLGYWVWYHHTVMEYPMVILGMIIIGFSGALCSLAIGYLGEYFMKWRRIF